MASAHLSELFHRVNMETASMMLDLLCLKILALFILVYIVPIEMSIHSMFPVADTIILFSDLSVLSRNIL